MDDHDQRFKVLLREFLPEFIELFFPDWAKRLDFSRVEWLPLETFRDPPYGERAEMDLVARIGLREPVAALRHGEADSCLAILHVEVESPDRATAFRPRMFDYYVELRRQYNIPVLPIALFLNLGLDGIGWDAYDEVLWDKSVLRFEYAYVGLPALDARPYLEGPSPLGVALAALMKVPREDRPVALLQARRLIGGAPSVSETGRLYLAECLENYFPLTDDERAAYEELIRTIPAEVRQMETIFEKRGKWARSREILELQLSKRFAPLSDEVIQKIKKMPIERVDQLLLEWLDAKSLKDLGLED